MRPSKLVLALGSTLLCFNSFAAVIHNDDHHTTFVGPTFRIGFTNSINDVTAYSIATEVGIKNFRVGGTWGWKIAADQYFKLSADSLWQDINYSFFSGNINHWVQQYSVGAAYQYAMLDSAFSPEFDITGFYSHAPSRTLGDRNVFLYDTTNVLTQFVDKRRIVGSDAGGIAPGVSIGPWDGGRIGVAMNYDTVNYKERSYERNHDANGFGGTFHFKQTVAHNVDINLAAGVRKPFNLYSADLAWKHVNYYGDWTLALFGDYVAGKNTLPNTWNAGVSADYFLDTRNPVPAPNLKGDYKHEMMLPIVDNLMAWTATPAVYLPQVLAIASTTQQLIQAPNNCPIGSAPALIFNIPQNTTISGIGSFSVASNFSGQNLTFSIATISPVLVFPDAVGVTASGEVQYAVEDANYAISVTASNGCGSATSNVFIVGTSTV